MAQHRNRGEPYMRKIDFMFHHEKEIRESVRDVRQDDDAPQIRNGSRVSDPTASKAIKNLSPIQAIYIGDIVVKYPERWIAVFDKTWAWCDRCKDTWLREGARMRYAGKDWRQICLTLHIQHASMFRGLERVRMYAALQAASLQLIKVD